MKKDSYTIKDAFTEAVNRDAESLPVTDPIPFSARFLKRMSSLFNKEPSPVTGLSSAFARRVAAVVICVVTVAVMTVGVSAAMIYFGGFDTNIHDKGTDLHISEEQQATIKDFIEEYYTLGAIPEGFEQTEQTNTFNVTVDTWWRDGNGKWIKLDQTAGKTHSWTLNTEDYPYEEIVFDGNEAIYYEWETNKSLMWIEDGYVFKVTTANMTREDVFILAESLTKE